MREGDDAAFYVDLHSTGKFGDVLTAAQAPIASRAALVGDGTATVERIEIPGAATVLFRPGGPHVRLAGLTRALAPGEVVIITLVFEKTGNVGVVTVVE